MKPKEKYLVVIVQNRTTYGGGVLRVTNMLLEHEPTVGDIMRIQLNQSYEGVQARVVGWQRVPYEEENEKRGGAHWCE